MNTSGLRHFSSAKDYQQTLKDKSAKALGQIKDSFIRPNPDKNALLSASGPVKDIDKASQVSISKEAKELSLATPESPSTLDISVADITPSLKDNSLDLAKAAIKEKGKEEVKEKVTQKLLNNKEDIKKMESPAIIFIKGHMFEGSDIEELANNIPRATLYSYSDHKDILNEINRRSPNQKIILVGHGFGGDTAVEIAQELNQAKHGFKKVDLLVTLDALGANNDFVPQNVVKNINFIGNQKTLFGLLNDGPKIAQNIKLTSVENELRPEGHTDIDEAEDIQFRIFHLIKDLVGSDPKSKDVRESLLLNLNKAPELKDSSESLQSKVPAE